MSSLTSTSSSNVPSTSISSSLAPLNSSLHRYNQLLPSTHVYVDQEGKVLLDSILKDFRQAVLQYEKDGHYDYVLALRQIKRIGISEVSTNFLSPRMANSEHALLALKYELPDKEWKEIVETMLKIALSAGLTLPRQSSLFGSLNRLLVKKRDTSLITIAWRPYWSLLQSIYLSHINSRALASAQYTGNHLKNLVTLIRYSTRYFPASAAGEIVATCTISLSHTNSHAMFNAQALLYVFLPSSVCIEELPPGTAEHWMRVWSWVDHCNEWDAIWAGIFARLAHPDGIVDVDGYNADNTPITSRSGAFPWGTYIPFFASKLQSALRIPVAGGQPIGKTYPYESSALISGAMPNGIDSICKLLVRIMTVKLPPSNHTLYGDAPSSLTNHDSSSGNSSSSNEPNDPVRTNIGDASVLGYLERLLRATASFFYPTSTNNANFITFLRNLSQLVVVRFGREAGAAQAAALLKSANIPVPPPEERAHAASEMGVGGTPPLTVTDIVRFVDMALPLAIFGLYSQKGQSSNVWEASVALKALATLAPARVTREFVTMASVALDPGTVNQTHQGPNALYALSILTRPLLFPVPHLAPSLPDFLHLSLPGIDANDNAKTSATLSFYITVLSTLPLIDSDDIQSSGNDEDTVTLPPWHPASPAFTGVPLGAPLPYQLAVKPVAGGALQAGLQNILWAGIIRASGPADRSKDGSRITVVENGNDDDNSNNDYDIPMDRALTDKEISSLISKGPEPAVRDLFFAARDSTSRIGEWGILVLERIFKVLEVLEKPAKGKGQNRRTDGISSLLNSFFQHYFIQCSPSLLTQILNRIHTWLTSVSCLDGVKDVAKMLNGLAMANPQQILNKLVPYHTNAATANGTSDKIIEWHARLLAGLVRQTGPALLPHISAIMNVVKVAFASKEKPTRKAGGKLLRWTLTSLLSTYAMDNRSHAPEDWQQPQSLWRKWAHPYQWVSSSSTSVATNPMYSTTVPSIHMAWHVPSDEERQVALSIVNDYLVAPMVRVQQFLTMITTGTTDNNLSSLSSSSSTTNFSPAVIKAEAEKLTLDCSIMLAAIRGGVFALTDGNQYIGDDDIIAIGTAGQSLLYDTKACSAVYARKDNMVPSSSSVPLRHALALTMQQMLRIVGGHVDFGKEVKALTIAIKFSFRLVASRGPKMSKTIQARAGLKNFKRYYHDHAEGVRTSHFTKILAAAAHAAGYRDTTSIVSTRGSTHQLDRGGMISRIAMIMNRRIAESLYAIPRALHFGRSSSTIGEVDWDMDDDDTGEDEEVLADTDDLETPSAGVDTSTVDETMNTESSSSMPSVWLARDSTLAIPSFGKRCIAKITADEQPYVLLLASTLQLAMHPYDNVRKSAQSHVLTMISTYGWLRKPAQLRALSRLDHLASFAVASQASAKVPELKAAAENYLSTLIASNKLPSTIPQELITAFKEGTLTSPTTTGAPQSTPTPVAGNENGSKVATVGGSASAAKTFFSDTEMKLTSDTSNGPPSVLFSPSVETKLAAKPTAAPLDHAEVLGLSAIAFMNIGPLIAEWFSFERMATVLLRSSQIVKGLPIERHAEVLRSLSRDAIRVLGYWHAIPIDPSHRSAHIHRTVRDRVLRYLLGTACPLAMNTESDLPTIGNNNNDTSNVTMSTGELSSSSSSSFSSASSPSRSTTTVKVPKVLQADGTRGPSAAFFPPSPLHWRYELLAGGLMLSLLAPGPATPCRLAIDSSRHEGSSLTHHGDDSTTDGRYMVAPEAVWLWVLSNILSDNVFLRMQAVYGLVQLLHTQVEMRGAKAPNIPTLTKVRELLMNSKYMSQFVAAIAQNHSEQVGEGSNAGGIETAMDTTGVRDLALPLDSVRAFVEFSRHSFSGGAVSSITHMILFELLHLAFPECLDICLDSLRQLGSDKGTDKPNAMVIDGEETGTVSNTGETETKGNTHELATLRNRQATVAEAFSGFLRSISFRRIPGGPNGGMVSYTAADATLPSFDSFTNGQDQLLTKVIAVAAPIMENVSLDWTPDWTNAVRFAIRQRHPSQMGPLVRYIFANASNAIESSDIRIPSAYDTANLEVLLDHIRKFSSNSTVTGTNGTTTSIATNASKAGSAATALSFAAQTRWLKFVQALFFEFFATIDGNGCSGSLPGVTASEEIAAETNVHADPSVVLKEHGSELLSTRQTTAALLCSLLPVLIRALGHPYKNCREEITRTIMVAVETGWAPSDVQAISPVPLPTIHIRNTDGSWTDTKKPVLTEPPTTQWKEWLVPTVAAMVHMASAATRLVGKGSSNKMDEKETGASTSTVPISDEEKWGRTVMESILYFIYDGVGSDTILTNPPFLVLAPIILITQNHPDRDVSKLSSVVSGQFSHTLTLRRLHKNDILQDTTFYRTVEQLLSTVQSTVTSTGNTSGTETAIIQSDSLHSGADVLIRTLEAYGMMEDSTVGGNDETTVTVTTTTTTKKTTVTPPPPMLRSSIISALQPVRTGGTTTGTANNKADQANSTWFVRRAVLNFITPMRARHLLVLTKPQDNVLLNFIESRLDDKQIEVQEAANTSLIGFVMTMPIYQRTILANRLLVLADTKMPKRPTAPVPASGQTEVTPEENENFRKAKVRFARALRKRHAGCLGISSIAAAHPFDVPKYLPPILAALARHVSDPNPVGNTVKECIGEFRRTHADNWDQHKTAFTQDELDDVLAVTSGGSYFA